MCLPAGVGVGACILTPGSSPAIHPPIFSAVLEPLEPAKGVEVGLDTPPNTNGVSGPPTPP